MRPIYTLSFSALLACGPLAPPQDATTAASSDTGDTTEPGPSPTTATPEPITTTTTTLDPTTLDLTTGVPTTTEENPFIIKPDGGTTGTIDCDVFKQDCDPGQKCTAWAEGGGGAWNATKCVDITGDGAPGEPCTTIGGGVSGMDDCRLGAMCWDVNIENQGVCIALCTGTPDAPVCPPKSRCAIGQEGILNLCIPTCDPLLQDCPGDDLCIPNGDSFLCVLDASGEMGAINDPCEFANACDQGLVCLNTAIASAACQQGLQGCCQPFCKFPDSPCPNPDQECLQWFDPMMEFPPEYENVGICAIPQ
jgi:hypothetical protein